MLGLMTTVAGMLIFALMIGVVSDTIGARVDDLKRGSAKVCPPLAPHGHRCQRPLLVLRPWDGAAEMLGAGRCRLWRRGTH